MMLKLISNYVIVLLKENFTSFDHFSLSFFFFFFFFFFFYELNHFIRNTNQNNPSCKMADSGFGL
jgi:hypothetical protein